MFELISMLPEPLLIVPEWHEVQLLASVGEFVLPPGDPDPKLVEDSGKNINASINVNVSVSSGVFMLFLLSCC